MGGPAPVNAWCYHGTPDSCFTGSPTFRSVASMRLLLPSGQLTKPIPIVDLCDYARTYPNMWFLATPEDYATTGGDPLWEWLGLDGTPTPPTRTPNVLPL